MTKSIQMKGFTYIELILVMLLMSIITVVSTRILSQGFASYLNMQYLTEANWQGQLAMERMILDIRNIGSVNNITAYTASTFSFKNVNGTAISYTLSGTNLTLNGHTLASGISALTFSYYDKNGNSGATQANIEYVTINLTVTKNNTNYSMKNSIYVRV
jgi:type II secretory pathway pseudopilin PulG